MLYIHEYDEPEPDDELAADPDPAIKAALAEARHNKDVISFDDVLSHLRRPWWRRALDKVRPFRR